MKTQEIQEMLEGYEINSLEHEGIVYVKGGKAFSAYDQKEIKLTSGGWKKLWKEMLTIEL